jgi:TonB family protein
MAVMNLSGGVYPLLWSVVAMGMIGPGNDSFGRIAANAVPYVGSSSATMATAAAPAPVFEGARATTSSSASLSFDIDAQPLDAALEAYGAATGQSIIYDSQLTEGRMSRPVKGRYTRKAALDTLLEGTGLMVRYTDADSLVLIRSPAQQGDSAGQAGIQRRYRGLVQLKVEDAFCRDPRLAAGERRIALRFWIGPAGRVERAELLDSTGDRQFDEVVLASLWDVSIGEAVPVGMVQPFTMLIMPRSSGHPWNCPGPAAGSSE